MTTQGKQPRTVLVLIDSGAERGALQRILSRSEWTLRFAPSFDEAKTVLRAFSVGVVICNVRFGDGHCWKDLLHETQAIPAPAQLIVADRLADEALWAEVLNLGGYDVLMTPFVDKEVLHVVPMAWGFREHERERAIPRPKPARSVEDRSCPALRTSAGAV